jgi:hypothetical protein
MNKFNFDYQHVFFTLNIKLSDSHITSAYCFTSITIRYIEQTGVLRPSLNAAGTSVSPTYITDSHEITEILLKMA